MNTGMKYMLGTLAGACVLSSALFTLHRMDRNAVQRWSAYTNTIPQMIAEGREGEARALYEDAWRDINDRIRGQRRDPIGFISQKDIQHLERDFTWDVLVQRARRMHALNDPDHPIMYNPKYP